ncbi:MAG: SDR family oxidoreductase [Deltaproteobacteria bacterium]|nr:SDR family oxidoreductase [Deltaproteobacteria bacterium]
MTEIRFDDRVAIVTGAGGGLGRAHALLLASRGAKVVVNDLGGAVDGSGGSQKAADAVVAEIEAAGGTAVANYDSVSEVEGAQGIVKSAVDAFGKVDIVINNAGILRDVSFHKMTQDQWDAVIAVHLTGTMNVSHAAWPLMREQGYGRIVNTASAAGLYGNFGQVNYGAAKLGILGLTHSLAQEGFKKGIRVNCIAPIAKSRMTETIGLPEEVLNRLEPSKVAPVVAYLVSEGCDLNGQCFSVGGGYVSRVAVVECAGGILTEATPEAFAAQVESMSDLKTAEPFANAMAEVQKALTLAAKS